jgi:alpha-L-fucosidase
MNKLRIILSITLLGASFARSHAQLAGVGPDTTPKDHPIPAIQDTESPAQRGARMAWFREARFGMFIHGSVAIRWVCYSLL